MPMSSQLNAPNAVDAPTEAYEMIELNGQIPALFDEVREGLGTEEMLLEEMVLEMRKIRET